jgi:hypothetical protein
MRLLLICLLATACTAAPPPSAERLGVGAGNNPVYTVSNGRGIPCSCTTSPVDAGVVTQCVQLDAGTITFGCAVGNLSSQSASIYMSCNGDVKNDGTNGREIPPGQERWSPSACLPYVSSTSTAQVGSCQCYGTVP